MDMNNEETHMEGEKTNLKKKRASKIVIFNASTEDATVTLEEMVKKYLLKKALELKDKVA